MANRHILYRFEIKTRGAGGPRTQALMDDVRALGMGTLRSVHQTTLYFVDGELTPEELELLGRFLFADPVEESFAWREVELGQSAEALVEAATTSARARECPGGRAAERATSPSSRVVEICRKPGVTDAVANEIVRAARELGIAGLRRAATGVRWELEAGWLDDVSLARLTKLLLANAVIERWEFGEIVPVFPEAEAPTPAIERYDIAAMDDAALLGLSAERRLALDINEMRAIREWFAARGRRATDVELEMLAQTWSEHCVHKTFKADVELRSADGAHYPPVVRSIFNTYIRKTTEEIGAPWVRSAFVDNAGIVSFDGKSDISFKVETHNHPSAVEPFGGANTGVGGVIRDIMGVSARPIAATDILCFGPSDMKENEVAPGSLHPRLIARGVISGVEDYGNKMGIPTVNGALHFHPGYAANPLVYCGCVGLAPAGTHRNAPRPGDRVIVLGGRTGRDGIRGATFSSMKMDGSTGDVAGASVQIGDPIVQKRALDVLLAARDAGLYDAVTDCGAGGLSSAVGEMGSELGADIELSIVGTKYPGLAPWELWLSEAQERMVFAVPAGNLDAFAELCARFESEFWDIGSFRDDGGLRLRMKGESVLDLSMDFIHGGLPRKHLIAKRVEAAGVGGAARGPGTAEMAAKGIESAARRMGGAGAANSQGGDAKRRLLSLLADERVVSREKIVRRYDHEVQGATVVKPFAGPYGDAPTDAAVLKPQGTDGIWGISLSNGLWPRYGEIDPYRAAWLAVDEAVRSAVAVGADPNRIAILDNFCMGDPNDPAVMWALLESARGLRDAALAFGTPIISGKDSFYNEYTGPDGKRHAVPPSLLVSALGFVPDVRLAVTSFLKKPGDSLWLVGRFAPVEEMGGKAEFTTNGAGSTEARAGTVAVGGTLAGFDPVPERAVPIVNSSAREIYRALFGAVRAGEVLAAHDLSDGGFAVALAEMCVGGRLGARIVPPALNEGTATRIRVLEKCVSEAEESLRQMALFGETAGCLLVEVAGGAESSFGARFGRGAALRLGEVTAEPALEILERGSGEPSEGNGGGGPGGEDSGVCAGVDETGGGACEKDADYGAAPLSISIDEMLAAFKGDVFEGEALKAETREEGTREVLS